VENSTESICGAQKEGALLQRCSLGCFPCSSEQRRATGSITADRACLVGWWVYPQAGWPLRPG